MKCMQRSSAALCLVLGSLSAGAQIPALINYQGRLTSGTNLYSGAAQIVFRVYDHPTNTMGILYFQDTDTVSVVDGLYSTLIGDEGTASDLSWLAQSAAGFWLEVAVNGTTLSPRERIAAVPYALLAGGVTNGAISTMMIADGAVMGYHLNANAVDSSKIQDGSIAFADIDQNGASAGQVMKWDGISAWVPSDDDASGGGESLLGYEEYGFFTPAPNAGGTDVIAMGMGCSAWGMYSLAGGGAYNTAGAENSVVDGGAYNTNSGAGAVIGGGLHNSIAYDGSNAVVAGGWANTVEGYTAAIGGGRDNRIQQRAAYSVIAGGQGNLVATGSYASAIAAGVNNQVQPGVYQGFIGAGGANKMEGGDYGFIGAGQLNRLFGNSSWGVIGGGHRNTIDNETDYAAIVGGYSNTIYGAPYAFIGGGAYNTALGIDYAVVAGGLGNTNAGVGAVIGGGAGNSVGSGANYSVIPGGEGCAIADDVSYAFAAGRRAKVYANGSFVWGGAEDSDFSSITEGQFLIRAPGGVGINTSRDCPGLHVVGSAEEARLVVGPNAIGTAGSELFLGESASGDWGMALRYNWSSNTLEVFGMNSFHTNGPHVVVTRDEGRVGIGTQNLDTNYLLSVGGAIRCEELVVETEWADFVFEPGYRLLSLDEVERHIAENGRLPGIPGAAEVGANGVGLGDMQVKLLQKIEELTLHAIRQEKEIEALQSELARLRQESGRE